MIKKKKNIQQTSEVKGCLTTYSEDKWKKAEIKKGYPYKISWIKKIRQLLSNSMFTNSNLKKRKKKRTEVPVGTFLDSLVLCVVVIY